MQDYSWAEKPVIFVFGSNLSGVHGAGAARYARLHHGAEWGVGNGPTGQAYALPTKGRAPALPVRTLGQIGFSAAEFCSYATRQQESCFFQLTAVGCGLAGYAHSEIAPLFVSAPTCVLMPPEWRAELEFFPEERFWHYGQFAPEPADVAAGQPRP